MSIDLEFVELTADVLEFFYKYTTAFDSVSNTKRFHVMRGLY